MDNGRLDVGFYYSSGIIKCTYMEFEPDEPKNQANIRKHGVSFRDCEPHLRQVCTHGDRRKEYGEARYISIGELENTVPVGGPHTGGSERTRLISARPASRKERQAYHEKAR